MGRPRTGPRPRHARWAIAAVFAVHGAVAGSFAARIPWISEHLHLGPAPLGLALVMPAAGAVIATPFGGQLVHRCASRTTPGRRLPACCATLALPALAPSLPLLCAALFLL